MTTRLSFFLLIAFLLIVTLASAQGSVTSKSTTLKMYYDFSLLPLKERKASYRNASSNNKSELWKTHLTLFLVKRPELDKRQKQIILAAMALVTPEHFGIPSSDSNRKTNVLVQRSSLEEQIVAAFSMEDAAKIFATLGDDTEAANRRTTCEVSVLLKSTDYKPVSDFGPYKQLTDNQFGGQDKDKDKQRRDCDCSTRSDWCPLSGYCAVGDCKSTDTGCGTFWNYPCNGLCR